MIRLPRREGLEDAFAFVFAIALLAVGFATSWPFLICGLVVASLVCRDLWLRTRAMRRRPRVLR